MRRITPTQWAHRGGREIELLGRTEAVLAAIGENGYIVIAGAASAARAIGLAEKLGIRGVCVVYASHGQEAVAAVPDGVRLGVDVDAWHGVLRGVWESTEAAIKRRFPEAVWG